MKVSVCMLTYNQEKFIAQAIESVMMQEADFDYELAIGEDCSTDKTRDICVAYKEKYPHKIRLLLRQENLGMMQNFVQTFSTCTGQYVALLEGDDYWTAPHKLQKQADFLDTHPDHAICFACTLAFDEDNHRKPYCIPAPEYRRSTLTTEDLLRCNSIATCSVMFRNGLVGSFPDWFFSLRMGDWPLHIMNAQHGKVGYIDELMAAYRIHGSSYYSSSDMITNLLSNVSFYKAINSYLNFQYQTVIKEMLAQTYQAISHQYLLRNDTANARRYAFESIRTLPLRAYFSKRGIIAGSLKIFAQSITLKTRNDSA